MTSPELTHILHFLKSEKKFERPGLFYKMTIYDNIMEFFCTRATISVIVLKTESDKKL